MAETTNDPTLLYFPGNYRWSMGFLLCIGAPRWTWVDVGEAARVGYALRDRVGDDDAWFDEWTRMADAVVALGREAVKGGHRYTAAGCFVRAARYYQTGERFLQPKSQRGLDVYRKSVDVFCDAAAMIQRPRIEPVEIPYEGTSLPALLVHPGPEVAGARPAPAMVFFDGFDVTKELQYGMGVAELSARGIGCLIVDGPGNGESIRFRNMPLIPETEKYATAAYEWIAARPEFDPRRIGVMALSLGGYYAPRAASREHRFACCVAWGAMWDFHEVWRRRFAALDSGKVPSLSVAPDHLAWVLGVNGRDEAMKKLEAFRLNGIVQNMRCPFLLLHGEGDEQVPLSDAQALYAATGSKDKTFRVFTRAEGGFHHCQNDNPTIAIHTMWDWIEEKLKPGA